LMFETDSRQTSDSLLILISYSATLIMVQPRAAIVLVSVALYLASTSMSHSSKFSP